MHDLHRSCAKSVAYKRQFSLLFRCTNSNCFKEQEKCEQAFVSTAIQGRLK